jgi:hypothetical protein
MKKIMAVCIMGLLLGTMMVFADHSHGGIGVFGGGGIGTEGGFGDVGLTVKGTGRRSPSHRLAYRMFANKGWGAEYSEASYFLDLDLTSKDSFNLGFYLAGGAYLNFDVIYRYESEDYQSYESGKYVTRSRDVLDSEIYMNVGIHIPLGLSLFINKHFEVYLEAVPYIGFAIFQLGLDIGIKGGLGLHYWF